MARRTRQNSKLSEISSVLLNKFSELYKFISNTIYFYQMSDIRAKLNCQICLLSYLLFVIIARRARHNSKLLEISSVLSKKTSKLYKFIPNTFSFA